MYLQQKCWRVLWLRTGQTKLRPRPHVYEYIFFKSANFSFQIRLPSTRIPRIRIFWNPLRRKGKIKSSKKSDKAWKGNFLNPVRKRLRNQKYGDTCGRGGGRGVRSLDLYIRILSIGLTCSWGSCGGRGIFNAHSICRGYSYFMIFPHMSPTANLFKLILSIKGVLFTYTCCYVNIRGVEELPRPFCWWISGTQAGQIIFFALPPRLLMERTEGPAFPYPWRKWPIFDIFTYNSGLYGS